MSQPKHHREGKFSLHTCVLSAPPSVPAPAPAPSPAPSPAPAPAHAPMYVKRFMRQQKFGKKKN